MKAGKNIHLHFTTRGLVRLVSCLCALVLVLGTSAAVGHYHAAQYRILLEDGYAQSLTGLASNLTGISATLSKGRYAGTPTQVSLLAAQLWRDTSAAKTALTGLPVGGLHLDNTNRFLTQVGDYAMALSRKAVSGAEVSATEQAQFAALCTYGQGLAEQFGSMEEAIISGQISMEAIKNDIESRNADNGAEPQAGGSLAAFDALEKSFADYPPLNYDGLFSDHIARREPRLLRGALPVPYEEAQARAAQAAGVAPTALEGSSEEKSALPTYGFYGKELWVGVSARGGFVTYLMRSRLPHSTNLTHEQALRAARVYLGGRGLAALTPTYYQNAENICTINFACTQGDITLYPDLVKVSVALDNGEILGYDARGYLFNHGERFLPPPEISLAQAKKALGAALTVQSSRLAVIPTAGLGEVLCYELAATAENGDEALVYINAQSGVEEQILLLCEDANGVYVR